MPAQPLKIACIGEVMIELVAEGVDRAAINVAGDSYNTAVYLARMLPEAEVSFVTALGTDRFSDRIIDHMQAHGVGTGLIERRDDKSPGLYAIETDASGERSFTYWRSDSAARTLFTEPCVVGLDRLAAMDVILVTGISMAILPPDSRARLISALDDLRTKGVRLVYDSNYRPALWDSQDTARQINRDMWQRTDIALPSVDDEMAIFGDATPEAVLTRLRSYGCEDGALKRGAEGPASLDPSVVPPRFEPATSVVDTTAAGDSFNAGFLAARLSGADLIRSMQSGHDLASKVIGAKGAIVAT